MATPTGPQASQITADAHRVAVEIDVSEIAGRLEREALRLINDLSQQGLTGNDLARAVADGLRAMSDAPVERKGREAVGEAFNLGRNLEFQRQNVARVVRTEILDAATCGPCHELDGREFDVNTPDYFEFFPPNKCDGREQCRGFYMPVIA